MTYRDDHDAALARAEALEAKLAEEREKRRALEAEVASLREERVGRPQATSPSPRASFADGSDGPLLPWWARVVVILLVAFFFALIRAGCHEQ